MDWQAPYRAFTRKIANAEDRSTQDRPQPRPPQTYAESLQRPDELAACTRSECNRPSSSFWRTPLLLYPRRRVASRCPSFSVRCRSSCPKTFIQKGSRLAPIIRISVLSVL